MHLLGAGEPGGGGVAGADGACRVGTGGAGDPPSSSAASRAVFDSLLRPPPRALPPLPTTTPFGWSRGDDGVPLLVLPPCDGGRRAARKLGAPAFRLDIELLPARVRTPCAGTPLVPACTLPLLELCDMARGPVASSDVN